MGSFKHPKFFDPIAADQIRTVYYEIMDVLDGQHSLSLDPDERGARATIIRDLIKLFADGTPLEDWKSKVLSTLPLR